MPLDSTTISSIKFELSNTIVGGRVDKITQPEPDEIILSLRSQGQNYKLLLTAHASAPRLNLTAAQKISPLQAPNFCMVLRKHLSGGRIIQIFQPDFERIIEIHIDAMDEMGDRSTKILLIEIMGKHSNIMILDANRKILDAIKHISLSTSAVRPILPGMAYSRPPSEKFNPLEIVHFLQANPSDLVNPEQSTATSAQFNAVHIADFQKKLSSAGQNTQKSIYLTYTGISPILASEICAKAGIPETAAPADLSSEAITRLYITFTTIMQTVSAENFNNNIYYSESGKTIDFAAIPLQIYAKYTAEAYDSPSVMLESYYIKRDNIYRVNQKTTDLRKLINTHLDRCRKKSKVYDKTLAEIKNRDHLRIKGELLTAYMYMIPVYEKGEKDIKIFTAENFYQHDETASIRTPTVEIQIDPALTPSENAQKYFKQYNKQKRTHAALQEQIVKNDEDIAYLESIITSMDILADTPANEADIEEIRAELAEQGFAKRKHLSKDKNKKAQKSKPLHYQSADGFDIYVGKNNTQNDQLTLRTAAANDIWLHTKDIPGSHVIIITNGRTPTDATILEAANLAAYHSKARTGSQVPVDYVAKKHVKKPNGAKPGFVIYDYHKTVYVTPKEI